MGNRADKVLSPAGQSLRGPDAKGDKCSMEQPSGVWSLAVSAVVWSLSQLYLESGILQPSASFDKCLSTTDGELGISPGP